MKGKRKRMVGEVVSDASDKTIKVEVQRLTKHRKYKKYFRTSTRLAAHDEKNEARKGDRVEIEETRPTSKTKRWRLVSILDRARI